MIAFFHRFLLYLPPEIAHQIGFFFLKIYQSFLSLFKGSSHSSAPAIQVPGLSFLKFPNRLGLAAGLDKNAEGFPALAHLGFGFIEVGTVTPLPQQGNPKPRLWRVSPQGLINQMGFNNCGVEEFKHHLRKYRKLCPVPVLANIGKNKNTPNELAYLDYQKLFQELYPWVDGFVVNVSSPNTVGLRALQSTEFLEKLESFISGKPVWVKLAPDLEPTEFVELLKKIKSSSLYAGCVLTNTSRQVALTEYQRSEGGYSGEKLFEKSLGFVARAREVFQKEKVIIGVGGINSIQRAQQMLHAGADLIEVYTAFVYQGPKFVKALSKELTN